MVSLASSHGTSEPAPLVMPALPANPGEFRPKYKKKNYKACVGDRASMSLLLGFAACLSFCQSSRPHVCLRVNLLLFYVCHVGIAPQSLVRGGGIFVLCPFGALHVA